MSRSCRSGALSIASTSASACGSTRRPLGPWRLRCLLAPVGAMGTTGLFNICTPIHGFVSMVPCSYICPIDCKNRGIDATYDTIHAAYGNLGGDTGRGRGNEL